MTLTQVRKFALALAGATESPHFERTSFRINGKVFLTALPSEPYIHVFLTEEQREPALALHPKHMSKLLWGGKVVGLRILLQGASVRAVNDVIRAAWEARIPTNKAFARVRDLCQALPGTTETSSWGHPNFRTTKRIFVALETIKGRPSIAIHLAADQVKQLCAEGTFFATPYGKGLWASVHADQRLNWRLLQELINESYQLALPPKRQGK